jgi:hypothetical protein
MAIRAPRSVSRSARLFQPPFGCPRAQWYERVAREVQPREVRPDEPDGGVQHS